jgi:hypothetical protein
VASKEYVMIGKKRLDVRDNLTILPNLIELNLSKIQNSDNGEDILL